MRVLCHAIKVQGHVTHWCCNTMHMLANMTEPSMPRVSQHWGYEIQTRQRACGRHKVQK